MSSGARRARAAMAAVALAVACVAVAGALLGLGPLAPASARAVTDPEEILAGSLQALLDAETVHVTVELSGHLPPGLAGTAAVDLTDASAEADVDLAAMRSRTVLGIPSWTTRSLELRTVWDTAWYREGAGPWSSLPISGTLDLSAVDLNPISLADRVRNHLEEHPATRVSRTRDLPCAAGMCRVVTLDAGPAPLGLLAAILPAERAAYLPDGDVILTLQADVATLRPVVAFLEVRGPAGMTIAEAIVRFRQWGETVVIEEPSPTP